MTDNKQLQQQVLNELQWDTHFDASHVAVSAEDGAVTLTGHVSSYPEIFAVREAVRRVSGVKAIADELHLQLPSESIREDSDIARSIVHVLKNSVRVNESNVKAEVKQGLVTLTGEVDWQSERKQIAEQISHIRGVRDIENRITLKKQLTSGDVKEQIEQALARNAELEAAHINVTINGDEVTLTGRVKAFYERNLIEAAAWHAPGVHKVIDKIEVG